MLGSMVCVLDDDQLAQRDHAAVRAGQADILQTLLGRAIGAVKFDNCGHRLSRCLIVNQADLGSRDGKRQGMGHIGDRDAVLRGLDLIHAHHQSRLRVFDIPVGINHAGGVLKDRLDLLRNLRLTSHVWTVNLGHQGLHHRRSRRNFADLNARAIRVADRVEQRTKPLGDGMALHAALLGRQQVHLNIGLIRLAAHVVVAHQSVEVIGPGVPV